MSNSQKLPGVNTTFINGIETNINRAVVQITNALVHEATDYGITWYGLTERRADKDNNIFPALFQSNTKDVINCMANDQWKGYGFFDLEDPEMYKAPNTEEGISKNRYSYISQGLNLIIYGDLNQLTFKQSLTNPDHRYIKQQIKDMVVRVLSRRIKGVRGFFNLHAIYSQRIEDVFKSYSVKDKGDYLYLPKFGFRFEGELTVTEQCNE